MQAVSFLKFYTAYADAVSQAQPPATGKPNTAAKTQAVGIHSIVSRLAKFIAPAHALSALKH
ncbi:MAG TPA: hypothetical protein VIF60_17760 [Burkholderiaceae bacterium]